MWHPQAGVLILPGLSGALFGALLFYLLGSLLLRRWVRINVYQLSLSMAAAFLVAIVCEVSLGKLYYLVTGEPLWQYRVWAIHEGYTSALNFNASSEAMEPLVSIAIINLSKSVICPTRVDVTSYLTLTTGE